MSTQLDHQTELEQDLTHVPVCETQNIMVIADQIIAADPETCGKPATHLIGLHNIMTHGVKHIYVCRGCLHEIGASDFCPPCRAPRLVSVTAL